MRIYLDTCCLNRPYDDLGDNVMRMESEAVLSIIDVCENGDWSFFRSDVLFDEILDIEDYYKREKVLAIYNSATLDIKLTADIVDTAKELEKYGFKTYDALHTASAIAGNADIILTCDKKFIKAAQRTQLPIPVKNPLKWITEVVL